MTPTNEELLRLAREAFPGREFEVWSDGQVHLAIRPFSAPVDCFPPVSGEAGRLLARQAEYAALLVLAGEPSPELQAAEERGAKRERAAVADVLRRRIEAERSAYDAFVGSEQWMNGSHDDDHPGAARAEAFEDVLNEIERAEQSGEVGE